MAELVVPTRCGRVRGERQNDVVAFRGIPYGAPPVGALRFRPPVPPEPWPEVRDATRFGKMAPQFGPMHWEDRTVGPYLTGGRGSELTAAGIQRGEDCLTVNVLTPRLAEDAAFPVMVYLHGCGYGSCSPFTATLADRMVAEQEVVLISVGHRLNAFGFLYLGEFDERYRAGNVGLLDLVLALRWVRENAAAFGGDPGRVTIFGESGGGWKVLDLLGMPEARGLFRRAIVESAPWPERVDRPEAAERAARMLEWAGIRTVRQLERVPTTRLVDAMRAAGPRRFRPVLDGVTLPHRTWVDRAPDPAAGIELMIGDCTDEMTALVDDEALFTVDWPAVVPTLSQRLDLPAALLEPVLDCYRLQRPDASAAQVLFGIWSDRLFGTAALAIAGWQAAHAPVHRYHFGYPTPVARGRLGAFHTAELPLALRLVRHPEMESLSRNLSAAWAGFARNGVPMPDWPAWRPDADVTMVFGPQTAPVSDVHRAELAAVRQLPPITTGQGR